MPEAKLIEILKAPLTPAIGVMFVLIGIYSLIINVADAKRKNHLRAEKAARFGGWFYIIGGTIVAIQIFF